MPWICSQCCGLTPSGLPSKLANKCPAVATVLARFGQQSAALLAAEAAAAEVGAAVVAGVGGNMDAARAAAAAAATPPAPAPPAPAPAPAVPVQAAASTTPAPPPPPPAPPPPPSPPYYHFTSVTMNFNYQSRVHKDTFHVGGRSRIVALGDFDGGALWVEGTGAVDVRHRWHDFDGTRDHKTLDFEGERYSLIYFTHESALYHAPGGAQRAGLEALGYRWPPGA